MCVPNTATALEVDPCDPIRFGNNTGWLCLRNTAVVLVDDRVQGLIKPAVYEGSPPGVWIIPDDNTYDCSWRCKDGDDEGWCTSQRAPCKCDPCGADASPEGAKNGWYCEHNWSTICIDPWGPNLGHGRPQRQSQHDDPRQSDSSECHAHLAYQLKAYEHTYQLT